MIRGLGVIVIRGKELTIFRLGVVKGSVDCTESQLARALGARSVSFRVQEVVASTRCWAKNGLFEQSLHAITKGYPNNKNLQPQIQNFLHIYIYI